MSYHETGTCQDCGAILETEYELDASLCFECEQRFDEEEESESEDCPYCGCSFNPRVDESCICSYPDADRGQPEGLFDDYLASGDEKDLPF